VREPRLYQGAFDCPHCCAFSKQLWFTPWAQDFNIKQYKDYLPTWYAEAENDKKPSISLETKKKDYGAVISNLMVSQCDHCSDVSLWIGTECIFPSFNPVDPPNPDMPDMVKAEYVEAASILHASPRGATALLRLALEKLCVELGYHGKINTSIGAMVKKGLDPRIQMALAALRVIGNEAVHPGTLDLRDDGETARKLFSLLNLIVEGMISHDKHVESLYNMLTPEQIKGIENRDKDSKGG